MTEIEPEPNRVEEEPQPEPAPASGNAHAIARWLLANHHIRAVEYEVWCRVQAGETIFSIRRDFPREATGERYGQSTLYRYAQRVADAITIQRMLERLAGDGHRSGCTVASGSRTRHAADPTGDGRRPDAASSWDVERMRLFGVLDRWSRKRGGRK